jgi:DNA-binding NarL/FixJ family response regulator
MTRVVIVSDHGDAMARLETAIAALADAELVRRLSGRSPVARIIEAHEPSLVLIAELSPHQLTVERLREARAAAPDAKVVVMAASSRSRWLADALRAGATAVLPGGLSAQALAAVLQEVLAPDPGAPALMRVA